MGYQAGGTDYHLDTRQRALDKTTEAKKREAESARERRIRQSGQRSDAQKILSATARGAAAYFTGGASETFGGGEMIDKVTKDQFTLNKIPWRFEAGTPQIAQVIALKNSMIKMLNTGLH